MQMYPFSYWILKKSNGSLVCLGRREFTRSQYFQWCVRFLRDAWREIKGLLVCAIWIIEWWRQIHKNVSFNRCVSFIMVYMKASGSPIFAATGTWISKDFLEEYRFLRRIWLIMRVGSFLQSCCICPLPIPLDMILSPSLFTLHDRAHLHVLRKEGVLSIVTFPCELIKRVLNVKTERVLLFF